MPAPRGETNLTVERLRELLDYDRESGVFMWRKTGPGRRLDRIAGGVSVQCGYVDINCEGLVYRAHRLAWFYVHGKWPEGQVDHINGIRHDNRIGNLRDVPQLLNLQNRRTATGKSGFLGVYPTIRGKPWRASIRHEKKEIHLGVYDSEEEAHAAYLKAKRELHAGCTL